LWFPDEAGLADRRNRNTGWGKTGHGPVFIGDRVHRKGRERVFAKTFERFAGYGDTHSPPAGALN